MSSADLLPPHNDEAEVAVLGSMLLDRDVVRQVLEVLTADDFYHPHNATIFRALDFVAQDSDAIDVVLVKNRLDAQGNLERIGGTSYLGSILERVPTTANALHYAQIVRGLARKRRVVFAAQDYERACRNGGDQAQFEALVRAREEADEKAESQAQEPVNRWDLANQIALPDPAPKDLLVDLAFSRPGVNIVFGPPGSGKSFAALQLALDLVMGGGCFMGAEELQIRPKQTPTGSFDPPPVEKCLWLFGSEDSQERMDLRSRKVYRSGPHADKSIPEGRFVYMTTPDDILLGTPHGWKWLDQTIATEKPTMLVLDTVASLTSDDIDVSKADHVKSFLRRFHRLRDKHRIDTFLVHHTRKSGTDPRKSSEAQADNMLGSQAWRSLTDGVLMLHAIDGDTARVTAKLVKGKDLEHQMPTILFKLERDSARFRPLEDDEIDAAPTKTGRPSKCSAEAILKLREVYPDGAPWNEIPKLLDCSPKTWGNNRVKIQADLLRLGHVVVEDRLRWQKP